MKKKTIRLSVILLIAFTFPAIGWVSIKKSDLNLTNKAAEVSAKPLTKANSNADLFYQHVNSVYNQAALAKAGLDQNLFTKALIGYYNLKKTQLLSTQKSILTIIDFSKKSSEKRLWIIDLENSRLLFNTLVAHGRGSGMDLATSFSDQPNSHKSSLGFYVTSETYIGKHGLSMRLDGLDKGFNSNAKERAVVIHGADYVSQAFVNQTGRLGRSHGCPALPVDLTKTIINVIKGQTALFISGPSDQYKSEFLNQNMAVANFISFGDKVQASI